MHSWPFIKNINNSRFCIKKNKCVINLINHQPDIDIIFLYVKDPYEAKYQFLISKCEKVGLKHCNDPKAFIEYSNDMQDAYRNIKE